MVVSVADKESTTVSEASSDGLLEIGGLRVPCLLDTGASHTLLSWEQAQVALQRKDVRL